MAILKLLVTHYADACRYIACGWTLTDLKRITLKGINKEYQEATIIWDSANGDTPIYPTGDAPPMFPDK